MAKGKGSGFLAAFILAVVSFFIMFFLLTDVSDKYFGVSYKGAAKKKPLTTEEKIDTAVQIASDAVSNVLDSVSTAVNDISSLIGTPSGNN